MGFCLGIFFLLSLVACGDMLDDDEGSIYGKVTNASGTAIPDIAVALYNSDGEALDIVFTSSTGYYEFTELTEDSYTITFTDIDGDTNGSYEQKVIVFSIDSSSLQKNVTLNSSN